MTLFAFRGVKSHEWTFYDPINMIKNLISSIAAILITLSVPAGAEPVVLDEILTSDTELSGEVTLADDLIIPEGITLTLSPGTVVRAIPSERTRTDPPYVLSNTEIVVRGTLIAQRGVSFAALDKISRGSWGGIVMTTANSKVVLEGVDISGADFGLLALKGEVVVKESRFSRNDVGLAVSPEVKMTASSNLFSKNGIGVMNLLGRENLASTGEFEDNEEDALTMAGTPPDLVHLLDLPTLPPPKPITREYIGEMAITEDTTWSGTVVLEGQVAVLKEATLTIEPGTRVLFRFKDTNGDGLGETWIIVMGRIRVLGEEDAWVLFDSEDGGHGTGKWDSLSIIASDAEDNLIRYAVFRRGVKAFHGHFSKVRLEHVYFENNLRGMQFQESENGTFLNWGTFIGNQSAMRFRDSLAELSNIVVTNNISGINFLRAKVTISDAYVAGNLVESLLAREADATIRRAAFVGNRRGPRFKGEGEPVLLDRVLSTGNMEEGLSMNIVRARIVNSDISGNGLTGLSVADAEVRISSSRLSGNGRFQVDNSGSTQVDARGNYWGSSNGPSPDDIYDGADEEGIGEVLTAPHLTEPFNLAFPGFFPETATLSGTLTIVGDVITSPKQDLKLLPGTSVTFAGVPPRSLYDLCWDHPSFPSSELQVLGRLEALGTKDSPVTFSPAGTGAVRPGMWGSVNLTGAKGAVFQYSEFSGAATGIHAREAKEVKISNSLFEKYDVGVRFSSTNMIVKDNIFRENKAGLRFHEFGGTVQNNTFDSNGTAIFVTSEPENVHLKNNIITRSRQYHIKLGEEVRSDIILEGGVFQIPDGKSADDMIFDKEDDDYLGKVILERVQRPTSAKP